MGLHRDIYWLGRQWTVTGFGMQAIDQRLKGAFDIEAALLWDDGVSRRMHEQTWVNIEDFDKALAVARKHFSEVPPKLQPCVESELEAIEPAPLAMPPPSMTGGQQQDVSMEQPPSIPGPPPFKLRLQGPLAHFLSLWRVRPGA